MKQQGLYEEKHPLIIIHLIDTEHFSRLINRLFMVIVEAESRLELGLGGIHIPLGAPMAMFWR